MLCFSRNSTIMCLSDSCMWCFSTSLSSDPNFEKKKNHSDFGHLVPEFGPIQCLTIPPPSSRAWPRIVPLFTNKMNLPLQLWTWINSYQLFPFCFVLYPHSCRYAGISLEKPTINLNNHCKHRVLTMGYVMWRYSIKLIQKIRGPCCHGVCI